MARETRNGQSKGDDMKIGRDPLQPHGFQLFQTVFLKFLFLHLWGKAYLSQFVKFLVVHYKSPVI